MLAPPPRRVAQPDRPDSAGYPGYTHVASSSDTRCGRKDLRAVKRLVFQRTYGIPSEAGTHQRAIAGSLLAKARGDWHFRASRAQPVQYVKICSLYGAGFYYIPGTDTCIKIGGWVRQYIGVNSNGNLTNGYLASGNVNTRGSNNGWTWKARGYITADARTQTEFGTLRGYIDAGGSTQGQSGNSAFNSNRAFIQLAGFTLGVSQSFYDLYPTPALSYFGGMINPSSDTGDGGQTVTAYTAQFGNGMSASLSLEAPRITTVVGPGSSLCNRRHQQCACWPTSRCRALS